MNIFLRLWGRFGRLPAPAAPGLALAPAVMPPAGEAREPVSDQDAVATAAHVAYQRELMDALCLQANAYVYRDYGAGEVVDFDHPTPLDESTRLEIDRYAADR